MSTKTTINNLNSAKMSVDGRLKRLKITREAGFRARQTESPIKRIGCFSDEIDSMEKTLLSMADRLNRATVKIPD